MLWKGEPMTDLIERRAAIDALLEEGQRSKRYRLGDIWELNFDEIREAIATVPSARPKTCEHYALCRHGRDENKFRARLVFCEYCHEDSDGYVKPVEKNCHAFIRFGMDGWELSLKANGWHGSAKIQYCPMCGRKLKNDK